MRLARIRHETRDAFGHDRYAAVLWQPPAAHLIGDPGVDPLLDLLRTGLLHIVRLDGAADARDEVAVDGAAHELAAPVLRPGKIVAVGLNYRDHTAEAGLAPPSAPLTFAKYPTSIIGPGEAITVPTAITAQPDWEAELAVIIGRRCGPDRPGTLDHVAGYTIANDVSARDVQFAESQWSRSKSFDTFCPLGPVLVTGEEFDPLTPHHIWTDVNGIRMQDANTRDMIFDVPVLLRFLSAGMTLEPGDIVLTGTPPGVGGFRSPPVFLADGDTVTVGIDGIGELTNPVRFR